MEFTFPLTLDYDKITKEKSMPPFIRLLALDLIENPYLSVGSFLQSMSDSDLFDLMDTVEKNEDAAMEYIILLTEMLSQAEGIKSEDLSQLTERVNTMITYVVIESLKRRGLVNVFYNNMSFGDEYGDKVIVERREG